jgi:hypothetical protein
VPGQVFLAGEGHGNNDNLGFLSLGLVHGADPGAGGQFFLEQIHLHVVGRHDENVIQGHRLDIACFGAVGLLFQPWDQLPDQFGLLDAGLGAGIMMTGNESDPGFREDEIIGALEHQALAGTMCFRRQAAVIGHFGNEPGDVRMHPKGFGQKNSPVFRVRQQPYKHYTDVDEVINKINSAIDEKKCIDISYFAVSRKTTSPRRVAPYNIWFAYGTFYMTGLCHMRHEIRTFACDRIRDIALSDEPFTPPDDFEIDGYLQSSFGVFHGRMTRVKIWFSPEAAMHIKERQWHDSQEIQDQPDGSIIFSAETAGIHDIRIWVLSWGAKARVLAPESLKEMIKSEIEVLNRLYE